MNPESSLKLQVLEKFPVFFTKEKVAEALGIATHNIPPLGRAGLLKPLAELTRYRAGSQDLRDLIVRARIVDIVGRCQPGAFAGCLPYKWTM